MLAVVDGCICLLMDDVRIVGLFSPDVYLLDTPFTTQTDLFLYCPGFQSSSFSYVKLNRLLGLLCTERHGAKAASRQVRGGALPIAIHWLLCNRQRRRGHTGLEQSTAPATEVGLSMASRLLA